MEHNPLGSFNLERVRAQIEESRRLLPSMSAGGGLPVAFMPEGEFVIRWFLDSSGDLFRRVGYHQRGQHRTHCPDFLRRMHPAGEFPPCVLCPWATQRDDWKLQRKERDLIYGHVEQTRHESKFWRPKKTYVIVGPTRLGSALTLMLDAWVEREPEAVCAMVNPRMAGPATLVSVKHGRQGSVTITPYTAERFPALTLGDCYKPLTQCWIEPDFNIVRYTALRLEVEAETD